MICSDPRCTGRHDRASWTNLCPRTKEAGLARERRRYAAMTWQDHHAKQLKTRRLKAVQRMRRRASGAV